MGDHKICGGSIKIPDWKDGLDKIKVTKVEIASKKGISESLEYINNNESDWREEYTPPTMESIEKKFKEIKGYEGKTIDPDTLETIADWATIPRFRAISEKVTVVLSYPFSRERWYKDADKIMSEDPGPRGGIEITFSELATITYEPVSVAATT
jgi:hypothetical protein